ncbi:unnamed protein product, partial [Closterium sp. NIES-53]
TTLAALGFVPSTADPSLFLRTDTSLPPFYVLVYVDDLVFATADTEALTLVKSELQKRHTCTDLGELRSYLGLQITRDRARRTITLTQSHMVHQVLQRFGFQYSSPQLTPLSTSHSLSAPPSDESVEPSGPYPELVGCLMYLMTCTRPHLAYPLSLLARYVAPGRHRKVHWDAAKRVLRYLCSTLGMGLVLGGRGPVVLTGHADASWVDDSATQRSSQGYTFSLGSGSVSWRSTRSSSVLSSSCEAEIYTGAMAAQELRWLGRAASFASSSRGQLRLAYVATRANTTDVFTKALPPGDHQRFVIVLGLLALLFLTGLVTTACSGYPPLRLWGASSTSSSRVNSSSSSSSSASRASTPGTSTSGTSSSNNNSSTSSSCVSTGRVSSSGSSTLKVGALSKPLAQLLRGERLRPGRQSWRSTHRTSKRSSAPRLCTPRLSTLRLSTSRLHTFKLSTPKLHTLRLSTPRLRTHMLSTPRPGTLRLRIPRLRTLRSGTLRLCTPKLRTPRRSTPRRSTWSNT